MSTIAIVNQKGGSGKTTTAVNLAAALAEKKRKVLVVDLDPQASATSWLGVKDGGRSLFDALTGEGALADIVMPTGVKDVDLIPSSQWLVGIERALSGEPGSETILERKLHPISGRYDYVLLDCPPSLGLLTLQSLTAAKQVLVPVEAHVMALAGVAQLVKTVETVKERLNKDLAITGFLVCRVDMRTRHSQDVLEQLRQRFTDKVFKTVIHENVRLAEAPSFAEPITTYDSSSAGAEDYRALATELLRRN